MFRNTYKQEFLPIDEQLGIYYFPAVKEPLSANVVIMEGRDYLWCFDAGADPSIALWADKQSKPLRMILSHFHPDHTKNLKKMKTDCVYVSKNTFRYVKQGEIVESDVYFSDGDLHLHIFPIPTSHAKGSLALEINETYCLLADAVYPGFKNGKNLYNTSLLKEQILFLQKVSSPYFLVSHKDPFVQRKEEVLIFLQEIYQQRTPDSPYIEVKNCE